MDDEEVIHLANGDDVPAALVRALDNLEAYWPGATFKGARPAIVNAILKEQKKNKKTSRGSNASRKDV